MPTKKGQSCAQRSRAPVHWMISDFWFRKLIHAATSIWRIVYFMKMVCNCEWCARPGQVVYFVLIPGRRGVDAYTYSIVITKSVMTVYGVFARIMMQFRKCFGSNSSPWMQSNNMCLWLDQKQNMFANVVFFPIHKTGQSTVCDVRVYDKWMLWFLGIMNDSISHIISSFV